MEQSPKLETMKKFYQFGRIGIGATAFFAPRSFARAIGLSPTADTVNLMRLYGSRDAVIGGGQLLAEEKGGARQWYVAGGAVDLFDALALTSAALREGGGSMRRRLFIGAGTALVFGMMGFFMAGTAEETIWDDLDAELAKLAETTPIEPGR